MNTKMKQFIREITTKVTEQILLNVAPTYLKTNTILFKTNKNIFITFCLKNTKKHQCIFVILPIYSHEGIMAVYVLRLFMQAYQAV